MCGRIVWVWDEQTGALVKKVDEGAVDVPHLFDVMDKQRYNVPPSSQLPILVSRGPAGGKKFEVAKWGFPMPRRSQGVFNTRIESAEDSRMWSDMLGSGNCIFAVKGFYEWKSDGIRKTPYYITRADGELMLLAGLTQVRMDLDDPVRYASIITTQANDFMDPVHERMPVILEEESLDAWFAADAYRTVAMCQPADEGLLRMHQVSGDVGDTKNDHAGLIEPVDQKGLGDF